MQISVLNYSRGSNQILIEFRSVWLPIPVVFCVIAAALVVATVIQQLVPSMIALGCVAAGIPVRPSNISRSHDD